MELKVICLGEPTFYELVDQVYNRLKEKHDLKEDKWINVHGITDPTDYNCQIGVFVEKA